MSRVHFHKPPELAECVTPGDASRLCLVCLMVARGAQLERDREQWQAAAADERKEQVWFAYSEQLDIREADLIGMSDMLPGTLVPLCWDHLGGLVITPAPAAPPRPLLQAGGPLPPGLRNGSGGPR